MQIKKLTPYSPEIAIEAIERAIAGGWTSLHPESIQKAAIKPAAHSGLKEFLADDES